ncbi:ABC transporter substrate-binding protein [Actinophytocola oryzae]|uniref:ABC transporter substrate-binding protein n=1 Tax=Actinophytocola oryzae TaxID=502181 RepID=UPI0014152F55|nr:ABC transporter substrate-binding protein [Actinophytocola oryzae]
MAALVAVVVVAAACSSQPTTPANESAGRTVKADIAAKGGSVTIRLNQDWRDFSVQTTGEGNTQALLQNAYATLLAQDASGKLIPYLAESYKATADTITFKLKKDITCSDGTPVTPEVVRASLQNMVTVKSAYNTVNWGKGPYTITADDKDGTVTFKTATPYGPLAYGFSNAFPASMTGIVCPAGLKPGADLTTQMYGAGPYTLVDAVHGDHVTFKLRSDFKGGPEGTTSQTAGLPEQVTYKIVPTDATAVQLLKTGGLDVASIGGTQVAQLLNDQTLSYTRSTGFFVFPLAFNQAPGKPTADKALRQALITAIDPKAFAQAVWQGRAVTSPTIATPDVECYDADVAKLAPKPSVDAAKKVLADAGYTLDNGKLTKNGAPVTIHLMTDNTLNPGPEYIADQWQQLGVTVNADNLPYQQYVTKLLASDMDVSFVESNSPGPIFGPMSQRVTGPVPPKGGTNYAGTYDDTLNSIQAKAIAQSGKASCADWTDFQEQLWKNWSMLPLGSPYQYMFAKGFDITRARGSNAYPINIRKLAG